MRRRRKIVTPSYRLDNKTKQAIIIVVPGHRCCIASCFKELADGELAYMGDVTKAVYCEHCMRGEGQSSHNAADFPYLHYELNHFFLPGTIKFLEASKDGTSA